MKKQIIIILTLIIIVGCSRDKQEHTIPKDTIPRDYFTESIHTYANFHDWLCWDASASYLRFKQGDVEFIIQMTYHPSIDRISSLQINYPEGHVASEAFLEDILSFAEGAEKLLVVTHKKAAEQVAAPDGE